MDALAKPGMQEAIKEQAEQRRASPEVFYILRTQLNLISLTNDDHYHSGLMPSADGCYVCYLRGGGCRVTSR